LLTFAVIAVDLGVPTPLSSSATVRVNVIDADDHAPTFDRREYTFAIYENRPPGTEVGHVTAVDHDVDDNGDDGDEFRFRYDLLPDVQPLDDRDGGSYPSPGGAADELPLPFGINPTTGRIVTRLALDRERCAEYRLQVVAHATNGVFRSVTASARVVVHVLDVNDNRPRIHWPPPTPASRGLLPVVVAPDPLRVSAAAPVGHVIAVVSAEDPDAGENGRLRYAIVGGDGNDNALDLFGTSTPEEGRIVVRRPLIDGLMTASASTATMTRSFALTVVVTDCGTPPLTASAVLNVIVDGNLPFAHAHRTFYVGADRRNGGGGHSTAAIAITSCLSVMFALLFVAVIVVFRRYIADRRRYASPSSSSVVVLNGGFRGGKPGGANRPTATMRWHPLSRLKRRVLSLSTDLAIGDGGGSSESQLAMFRRNGGSDVEKDASGDDVEELKIVRPVTLSRDAAILRDNTAECSRATAAERLLCAKRKNDCDSVVFASGENVLAPGVAAYYRM
jgi:hypothetical protein